MSGNWNHCPGPEVCFALEHASEDSLKALVVYQARQLDRMTGGKYQAPSEEAVVAPEPEPIVREAPRDLTALLVSLLSHEDIYRRPARVAAPRLLERLAAAGLQVTTREDSAA